MMIDAEVNGPGGERSGSHLAFGPTMCFSLMYICELMKLMKCFVCTPSASDGTEVRHSFG